MGSGHRSTLVCPRRRAAAALLPVCMLLLCAVPIRAQNRVEHGGQDLYLNGLNLAWRQFADDIGPTPSTPNTNHFADVFSQIEANGGNIMRLWLHTNGAHTPEWSGTQVTGPGTDTIEDLKTILDIAWEHDVGMMLCLWSFDMLRTFYGPAITDRARAILTNEIDRATYIDNALTPMVSALAGHPAIIAWEIFNEPEGMSQELGWDGVVAPAGQVPMSAIQAFINVCAGTIHRTDPGAKVTNGSSSFYATTDVGPGNFNYYTDSRLIAAGGDSDGTLDFYCVHYYDWAGTSRSPFQNSAAHWGLTKPLVVAEFFADCDNCTATPFETLYQSGYAGALAWSWTDGTDNGLSIEQNQTLMLSEIDDVSASHPGDVLIHPPGSPDVQVTAPANGTTYASGQTVFVSADASDTNGTITNVEFYAGSALIGEDVSAPYAVAWTNPPAGPYLLKAVAGDDEGLHATSAAVGIWVGLYPAVSITAPTNGEAYASAATVMIQASASDTDGTIAKVEFFEDGTKLGEDSSAPYEYNWVSPPDDLYALTAVVTDDSGLTTMSDVVNITVGSTEPPGRLEAEDAVLTGDVTVELDPTASAGEVAYMRDAPGSLTWIVNNVPSAGSWEFVVGYKIPFSTKYQDVYLNGEHLGQAVFGGPLNVWQEAIFQVPFEAGYNEFQIVGYNGWMVFDYIEFDFGVANTPPVLSLPSNMTVNAGTALTLPVTATDAEAPPQVLRYELDSGPTGSAVNWIFGTFTWRPTVLQADSTNPVAIVVIDDGSPILSSTGTFTIVVQPLADAVINSIDVSGGQVSLQVTGDEGPDYSLLTTTDMQTWEPLYSTNSPTLPVLLIDSNLTADPFRAYSIGLGP